jgi:adenylate kinase
MAVNKILILGPQGSGKGTQATKLSQKLGIPALSMGQLLRDEVALGGELGEKIGAIINAGNLVSDEVVLEVLKKRLQQPDAENGYILDGYPRNSQQYEAFKSFDVPTAVLVISVPREETMARLASRAALEGRVDDTPELIEKRLNIYEAETKPVVDIYRGLGVLREVNGLGTPAEVEASIHLALGL